MTTHRLAALGVVGLALASGCSAGPTSDETAPAPTSTSSAEPSPRTSEPTETATASRSVTTSRAPDCTGPTVEITELYQARAWPSTGEKDASYPMFVRYTIRNPGEHEVEVFAMDVVVDLRPTPDTRPLTYPDAPQPWVFEGTQVGTTLHPPVLEPGESFDGQWDTYGDPQLVVVGGKATADITRLHYQFTDEKVEQICAPLRPGD